MIELKTPAEIDKMAVTGRFVAKTLTELSETAEPGMNLMHLEKRARRLIEEAGAKSCYWDYAPSFGSGPFRNVICLSVNDGVLHGKPHDYVMQNGDLLTLDFAVSIDGWVADAARSVVVGEGSDEDQRLIDSTWAGLEAGIGAAQPGAASATSRRRSGTSPTNSGSRSTSTSAGTGSGTRCTRTPTSPTAARAVAAWCSSRA